MTHSGIWTFGVYGREIFKIINPQDFTYEQIIKHYYTTKEFKILSEFTNTHVTGDSIKVHDHGISCALIHYVKFDPGVHRKTFIKHSIEKEYYHLDANENDIVILPPGVLHGVAPSASSISRITTTVLFDVLS